MQIIRDMKDLKLTEAAEIVWRSRMDDQRIDYPEQNLRRAQVQMVLFQDMMTHMDDMKRIIRDVYR